MPQAPKSDFLQVRYRADTRMLLARWQRPVSGPELRQGYRIMLKAAQVAQCSFWLIDVRGRNALDQRATHWLLTEFVPQLLTQLPGPVALAYLVTPAHLAHLQQAAGLGVKAATPQQVAVAHFADEGAVTRWLTQQQRQTFPLT